MPATDDDYDKTSIRIRTESQIYKHLGSHPRILQFISCEDDYLDLAYMKNGNLEDYLRKTDPADVRPAMLRKFAHQALEAVNYIHHHDVVHSDLAARQFLVDDSLGLRLSDFGGSSLSGSAALGLEGMSHFLPRDDSLPNTIQSDIFALGSTLYEIFVGTKPYHELEDSEIEDLYTRRIFPSIEAIEAPWGHIIARSWNRHYTSTDEILLLVKEYTDNNTLLYSLYIYAYIYT